MEWLTGPVPATLFGLSAYSVVATRHEVFFASFRQVGAVARGALRPETGNGDYFLCSDPTAWLTAPSGAFGIPLSRLYGYFISDLAACPREPGVIYLASSAGDCGILRLDLRSGWAEPIMGWNLPVNPPPVTYGPYEGLAVGDDGTIYVANYQILARYPDGTSEVLAGIAGGYGSAGFVDGPLHEARLDALGGLAWHDGALYVADSGNRAVRRIDLDAGLVETIAGIPPGGSGGTPVADIDGPTPATTVILEDVDDVADAPDGTLYLTTTACVLALRDGLLEPVVGRCGEPGYDGDGGPALEAHLDHPGRLSVSPDGAWLYIADWGADAIRAVRLKDDPPSPALPGPEPWTLSAPE